jgi:alpha-galactosidase
LLLGLGMPADNIQYDIAGINHQAWLLRISRNGEDLYPEIKRRAALGQGDPLDKVRYEVMKHFGYYVTESTQHTAEYMPYFIKHRYPQLIDELGIKPYMYREWGGAPNRRDEAVTHIRTGEYASYILEAMETGKPYKIAGNVMNEGLIDNLPRKACVEVPCLVDASGILPCHVGELPLQCAALNRTNINVQQLVVHAALTGDVESVYHAAMLDPHTAAELSLSDIRGLCGEMLAANQGWLPMFQRTVGL